MIVCHCMNIKSNEIEDAINWMRAADPSAIITPRKVYRALGKSPDCGGCLKLFVAKMRENNNLPVPMHLRNLTASSQERDDEGQRESHRISEQGA